MLSAASTQSYSAPRLNHLGAVMQLTLQTSSGSRRDQSNQACDPPGSSGNNMRVSGGTNPFC